METIKQRTGHDCTLACLAMATGKNYDDIFPPEFVERVVKNNGSGGAILDEAYERAGLKNGEDMISIHVGYNAGVEIVKKLLWGRRAMISVPSLNIPKGMHHVYWDGENLHDPSTKKTYTFLANVCPEWITLFKGPQPCQAS